MVNHNVEIARGVNGHVPGVGKTGAGGWSIVPGEARTSVARCCRDDSPTHLPDALVVKIRDIEIAGGVNRHAEGVGKAGAGGRYAVP